MCRILRIQANAFALCASHKDINTTKEVLAFKKDARSLARIINILEKQHPDHNRKYKGFVPLSRTDSYGANEPKILLRE